MQVNWIFFFFFFCLLTLLAKEVQASFINPNNQSLSNLNRRQQECILPAHPDIVPVTPHLGNHGWAMSWDKPCLPGTWCQYACVPGKMMHQWDPAAVAYQHPMSENGGLFCGADGIARKPFPDRDYCYPAVHKTMVVSHLGRSNYLCQTVLPGDEGMRIPNLVAGSQQIAIPGDEYWLGTGTHYYVNSPDYDVHTSCIWGSKEIPAGNWAPYIIGLKERADGTVFLTLGWNPVWLETATPYHNAVPAFGMKAVCHGPHCENMPCTIDPAIHLVNQISHPQNQFSGAGGASGCVTSYNPTTDNVQVVLFPAGQGNLHN
ncbi:hypothetical protein BZA77DRAFT_253384 [Pyronema omphalodes]|nr:hypothetical protein BZA77DRAFT_253384 [Pyronema omphalodes]